MFQLGDLRLHIGNDPAPLLLGPVQLFFLESQKSRREGTLQNKGVRHSVVFLCPVSHDGGSPSPGGYHRNQCDIFIRAVLRQIRRKSACHDDLRTALCSDLDVLPRLVTSPQHADADQPLAGALPAQLQRFRQLLLQSLCIGSRPVFCKIVSLPADVRRSDKSQTAFRRYRGRQVRPGDPQAHAGLYDRDRKIFFTQLQRLQRKRRRLYIRHTAFRQKILIDIVYSRYKISQFVRFHLCHCTLQQLLQKGIPLRCCGNAFIAETDLDDPAILVIPQTFHISFFD